MFRKLKHRLNNTTNHHSTSFVVEQSSSSINNQHLNKSLPVLNGRTIADDDCHNKNGFSNASYNSSNRSADDDMSLVEGTVHLIVHLPGEEKVVELDVDAKTPMMDLLVQVTTSNGVNPGGLYLKVATDRPPGYVHYKPNTPVGRLQCQELFVVPKFQVCDAPRSATAEVITTTTGGGGAITGKKPRGTLPFEPTIRLSIDLPRNQKTFVRINPASTLRRLIVDICRQQAQSLNLSSSFAQRVDNNNNNNNNSLPKDQSQVEFERQSLAKYTLKATRRPDLFLDLDRSIKDTGLTDFTLEPINCSDFRKSTGDIFHQYARMDLDEKRRQTNGATPPSKSSGGFFGGLFKKRDKKEDRKGLASSTTTLNRDCGLSSKSEGRFSPPPPPPPEKKLTGNNNNLSKKRHAPPVPAGQQPADPTNLARDKLVQPPLSSFAKDFAEKQNRHKPDDRFSGGGGTLLSSSSVVDDGASSSGYQDELATSTNESDSSTTTADNGATNDNNNVVRHRRPPTAVVDDSAVSSGQSSPAAAATAATTTATTTATAAVGGGGQKRKSKAPPPPPPPSKHDSVADDKKPVEVDNTIKGANEDIIEHKTMEPDTKPSSTVLDQNIKSSDVADPDEMDDQLLIDQTMLVFDEETSEHDTVGETAGNATVVPTVDDGSKMASDIETPTAPITEQKCPAMEFIENSATECPTSKSVEATPMSEAVSPVQNLATVILVSKNLTTTIAPESAIKQKVTSVENSATPTSKESTVNLGFVPSNEQSTVTFELEPDVPMENSVTVIPVSENVAATPKPKVQRFPSIENSATVTPTLKNGFDPGLPMENSTTAPTSDTVLTPPTASIKDTSGAANSGNNTPIFRAKKTSLVKKTSLSSASTASILYNDPKRDLYPTMSVKSFEDEYFAKHKTPAAAGKDNRVSDKALTLQKQGGGLANLTGGTVDKKRQSTVVNCPSTPSKPDLKPKPVCLSGLKPTITSKEEPDKARLLEVEYQKLQDLFNEWKVQADRNDKLYTNIDSSQMLHFQRLQTKVLEQHELVQTLYLDSGKGRKSSSSSSTTVQEPFQQTLHSIVRDLNGNADFGAAAKSPGKQKSVIIPYRSPPPREDCKPLDRNNNNVQCKVGESCVKRAPPPIHQLMEELKGVKLKPATLFDNNNNKRNVQSAKPFVKSKPTVRPVAQQVEFSKDALMQAIRQFGGANGLKKVHVNGVS